MFNIRELKTLVQGIQSEGEIGIWIVGETRQEVAIDTKITVREIDQTIGGAMLIQEGDTAMTTSGGRREEGMMIEVQAMIVREDSAGDARLSTLFLLKCLTLLCSSRSTRHNRTRSHLAVL